MPTKTDSDISDTMRTTVTERKKAEILKRCFINMMKCFRICKKTRKSTEGPI